MSQTIASKVSLFTRFKHFMINSQNSRINHRPDESAQDIRNQIVQITGTIKKFTLQDLYDTSI